MFGLGFQELLIILLIVVFITGGKKLPQIGESIGRGISNFKRSIGGTKEGPPRVDKDGGQS